MDSDTSMLVTGGGRGLGLEIARAASKAGYRVGVIDVDLPAEASAAENVATQNTAGDTVVGSIEFIAASVVDEGAVSEALDRFGTPDVVVNNAGIVRFGPLLDIDQADFRTVLDVNLVGTFLVARTVARRWTAEGRGGIVINIGSMNGVAAGPNAGAYGSSKAGVALLTSQMALEWGSLGIRVNAIAPGLIDAGMSEPIYADAATRSARESKVPLGRLGLAEDIANVVLFLASEQAAYIHGQNIVVDGGVTGSVIAHLPRPATVDSVGHR